MNGLHRAIHAAGGQSALANHLGQTVQTVHNWTRRGSVPPRFAPIIERDFDVPAEELCPDVPWHLIRGTRDDEAA